MKFSNLAITGAGFHSGGQNEKILFIFPPLYSSNYIRGWNLLWGLKIKINVLFIFPPQ